MVQITKVSEAEKAALEKGYKMGKKQNYRERCQGILLSISGLSVAELATKFGRKKDTIYSWIKNYEEMGIKGLENKKGQGIKSKLADLSEEEVKQLQEEVENSPQNLKQAGARLSKAFNFKVSKWMLINYIKKNGIIPGGESENG